MDTIQHRSSRGFTLVEIIIVVAIISLLSAVILASVSKARENTRDKVRLSDIAQLELTFKLYAETNNAYPADLTYDSGVELGVDSTIASDLAFLLPTIPRDPKSDGSTHQYVYDTDFECTAAGETVLYVQSFETLTAEANAGTLCTSGTTDAGGSEYIIILE